MTSVKKLYEYFEEKIPPSLSCEWDNDGKMCVPDPEKEVKKALICLDVTNEVVDHAENEGFDCIISHHPLVFRPLSGIDGENHVCRKLCRLIKSGIAVFSFHTRLDKAEGGVNDVLAGLLGLKNVENFSDVGRMGEVDCEPLSEFASAFAGKIGSDRMICVDAGKPVRRVAVIGGSGKGSLEEACENGCDTFVTGEMPFSSEHDAKEMGINLICGGHYFTENVICPILEEMVREFDGEIYTEIFDTLP